jgi:hypothetical protein
VRRVAHRDRHVVVRPCRGQSRDAARDVRRVAVGGRRIAGTIEIEHLFRELVHPQQLVDRQVHELARVRVGRVGRVGTETPPHDLETVADVRYGIADLVREAAEQSARRRDALPLHQLRLKRHHAVLPLGQRTVRRLQLAESCGERSPHGLERARDFAHLADGGRGDRRREAPGRHLIGGQGERFDGPRDPSRDERTHDQGERQRGERARRRDPPELREQRQLLAAVAREHDGAGGASRAERRPRGEVEPPGGGHRGDRVRRARRASERPRQHVGPRRRNHATVRMHDRDGRARESRQQSRLRLADRRRDAGGAYPAAAQLHRRERDPPDPAAVRGDRGRHLAPARRREKLGVRGRPEAPSLLTVDEYGCLTERRGGLPRRAFRGRVVTARERAHQRRRARELLRVHHHRVRACRTSLGQDSRRASEVIARPPLELGLYALIEQNARGNYAPDYRTA